jgi:hypothetical protein
MRRKRRNQVLTYNMETVPGRSLYGCITVAAEEKVT